MACRPLTGTLHSPTSPGRTLTCPGRLALAARAGGRLLDGQAEVASTDGAEACSPSLPTGQLAPPRFRSRRTRVRVPVGAFTRDKEAVGASSSDASLDTAGSVRTMVRAVRSPEIQVRPTHSGSKASWVTPAGSPFPPSRRAKEPVEPGATGAAAARCAALSALSQPLALEALVRPRGWEVPSCTGVVEPTGQVMLLVLRADRVTVVDPERASTTVLPSSADGLDWPATSAGAAPGRAVHVGSTRVTVHAATAPKAGAVPSCTRYDAA